MCRCADKPMASTWRGVIADLMRWLSRLPRPLRLGAVSRRGVTAALACALVGGSARASNDLDLYLARPGLEILLATHLEERLEATRDPQERQAIAARLAATLSTLLDRTRDAEEVELLERRCAALLDFVTGLDADELRLALVGARHRNAARTLELHRMRTASEADVAAAIDALDRMLPELERVDRALASSLRNAEVRVGRTGGIEGTVHHERASRLAGLAAQAAFLRGWTIYYRAMVDSDRGRADDAIAIFARVLDLGEGRVNVDDVSISLMEIESYARAVLGMALVQGLRRNDALAAEWVELLFHEAAHPGVRSEAPAWRIAVLLDAEPPRHGDVTALLETLMAEDAPIPVAWLKLAAARGLEGANSRRPAGQRESARKLANVAIGSLASRGEVAHVLDLARRFGGSALGDDGFIVRYVRGVERFEAARARHDDDEPTDDPETLALYAAAAEELEAALAMPDTGGMRDGVAACRALLGWTLYHRRRMDEAVAHFLAAADAQRPADAAESRWMAIVCLDHRVREDPSDADAREALENAIDRFLDEHPGSPRAGRLLLRRALVAEPSRESMRDLQNIPPGSDAYVVGQRQALHVLYRLIREARSDEERTELSRKFLLRALPLIEEDERLLAEGHDSVRDGRIVRIRQSIEISLTPQVDRPSLARELIDRLEEEPEVAEEHAAEIALRRVQVATAEDDLAAAERWAEALRDRRDDPNAEDWYVTAARIIFRMALMHWRRDGALDRPGPLAAVDRWGSAVIERPLAIEDDAERARALSDPQHLPYLSGTAEAAVRRWRLSRDPDEAVRAEALLRQLLLIRENDEASVRWLSILLEESGRLEPALALVRRLVAGSRSGSEVWFESRYRQIDILLKLDPQRARAVMQQHRALNPDYGPEPWGDRFRRLDERIEIEHPPSGGVRT